MHAPAIQPAEEGDGEEMCRRNFDPEFTLDSPSVGVWRALAERRIAVDRTPGVSETRDRNA
jgi:hypothetical protein